MLLLSLFYTEHTCSVHSVYLTVPCYLLALVFS